MTESSVELSRYVSWIQYVCRPRVKSEIQSSSHPFHRTHQTVNSPRSYNPSIHWPRLESIDGEMHVHEMLLYSVQSTL